MACFIGDTYISILNIVSNSHLNYEKKTLKLSYGICGQCGHEIINLYTMNKNTSLSRVQKVSSSLRSQHYSKQFF